VHIFYSPVQRKHHPTYVVKQGAYAKSFDLPERIESILAALREASFGSGIAPDNFGLAPVLAVHDTDMIDYLSTAYERQCKEQNGETPVFPTYFPPPGQRRRPSRFEGLKGLYCTNTGVPIGEHTWAAALASAACAASGARSLQSGESCVYALCRPPGHHAGPDFFGGYCYLNNAAIAAQYLCQIGGRVAILDIDYHHGNGTQAIFYSRPQVWYGSLHIDPDTDYPFFAGYADEIGRDDGKGTNWNVPLPPGTSQDQYLGALDMLLDRLAVFDPRWLVVSAGFDTYAHDPVGTFQLTTAGYHEIGRRMRQIDVPTLVVQEGGYHIPDLGKNVVALLHGLA
jgi:acetoin utilization deacetylase AcuC-like enzyme